MLTQENLEMIEKLPQDDLIMSKFIEEDRKQNAMISEEIERNMAFAMIHYNEESRIPYLFRRISSTSTVKSIYFNSSPSSESSNHSLKHDLQIISDEKPSEKVYYNILVAGDSGLGKTSFINTFMYLKFNQFKSFKDCAEVVPMTTEIFHNKARRTEGKLDFYIDMVDSPGYGSFRNVDLYTKYISKYLVNQIIQYKQDQDKVDKRIHCCLYFVDSVLKQDDVNALKEISKYTVVIPIIAKSDTCTTEELKKYKRTIVGQLIESEIDYFQFEGGNLTGCIGTCPPFCVISAVSRVKSGAKSSLGRVYSWGLCDIENPTHSDFPLLSKLLIGRFYHPVKAVTKRKVKEVVKLWEKHEENRLRNKKEKGIKRKSEKLKTVGRVAAAFLFGIARLIAN